MFGLGQWSTPPVGQSPFQQGLPYQPPQASQKRPEGKDRRNPNGMSTRELIALALASLGQGVSGGRGGAMQLVLSQINARQELERARAAQMEERRQAGIAEQQGGKTNAANFAAMTGLGATENEAQLASMNPEAVGSNIASRFGPQSVSPGTTINMLGREPMHGQDRYITPQDGGVFRVGPTGEGSMEGLPRPQTAAERDALPPGTRYQAPDGSIKIATGRSASGGGGSNATGGFPYR